MDCEQETALSTATWRPGSARSRAEAVYLPGERQTAERISQRLFGRPLHLEEYAGLAGAFDEAKVEVGASGGRLYIEMGDPFAAYRGHYYLYRKEAATVLLNDGFHIHVRAMRRHGLGLRMFLRQARNAAALGVARIDAVAGRRHDENGYYTWPRFGFECVLPASIRRFLPVGLEQSHTVLDVMACEKGRSWWEEHGVTVRMSFDLAPGSRSQRTLVQYVRARTRAVYMPTDLVCAPAMLHSIAR
jgi:hypothetical protein